MKKAKDQSKIFEENWHRALADYQNLVKRVEGEKKEFIKFATASIFAKLIPVLDIMELAAKHSEDMGVKMAAKQFSDALLSEGLVEIVPAVGESFDHGTQECGETVLGDKNDTVAEVILKGYKIDGLVIRPAKVKVFKLALDK